MNTLEFKRVKLTRLLLFVVVTSIAACTKEKSYVYEVNNVTVQQPGGVKGTAKSTTEFISIAYADLFGTTISNADLVELFTAYSSFGDKKLIEDRIIRSFLDKPGVQIPSKQTMRSDLSLFINDSYKKFYNREPNEFEKYYMKNFLESDTTVSPSMLYYSFMTSNEYRYY